MNPSGNSQYTDTLKPAEGSTAAGANTEYLLDQVKQHDELLKKYQNALQELTAYVVKKIKKLESKHGQLKEEQKNLKSDKHNLIEILGVFVAIFTFMSIEIQILKSATDFLRIAGLSLITFSGLIFFIMTLFIVGERWINRKTSFSGLWIYCSIVLVVLGAGVLLVGMGDYRNPADVKNDGNFIELKNIVENDKKLISDLNTRLIELERKKQNSKKS